MATCSAAGIPASAESPVCRPEEDPFLLLESTLLSVQEILLRRRGLALRLTWIEQPYGEEEITILEEGVIPAIQQCLARIDELQSSRTSLSRALGVVRRLVSHREVRLMDRYRWVA